MNVLQRITLAIVSVGAASELSAGSAPGNALSTGQRIVAPAKASVVVQVEYCMRNAPELQTELALSHATYALAVTQAAEILSRRFPNARVVDSAHLAEGDDVRAKEFALKQAQSTGYERLCPALVQYMHNATGESLAKNYGDTFADLIGRQRDINP